MEQANTGGRKPVEHKAKPRSIRVTDPQWDTLREKAKENGLSITKYLLLGKV